MHDVCVADFEQQMQLAGPRDSGHNEDHVAAVNRRSTCGIGAKKLAMRAGKAGCQQYLSTLRSGCAGGRSGGSGDACASHGGPGPVDAEGLFHLAHELNTREMEVGPDGQQRRRTHRDSAGLRTQRVRRHVLQADRYPQQQPPASGHRHPKADLIHEEIRRVKHARKAGDHIAMGILTRDRSKDPEGHVHLTAEDVVQARTRARDERQAMEDRAEL